MSTEKYSERFFIKNPHWGSGWKVMWSHGNSYLFCSVFNMSDITACQCANENCAEGRG